MADEAIAVSGLSKHYRVGTAAPHRSLIDAAGDWWKRRRSGSGAEVRDFWALRDVSFSVMQGEAVGLIGHNGAGKSTLLKILSRITEPTSGEVTYRGRIGSLLEVGTGFHPQLSGRDNVYLSGAILGMSRHEIARKFDEIVDFSGVEAFLDEPVKHYSSGMYLRLAFAVAAHLETDILLVDEVLAVGDLAFQRKCLGRMESIEREGRTIVFVSHNLSAVQALCRRAIVLQEGRIMCDGPVEEAVAAFVAEQTGDQEQAAATRTFERSPTHSAVALLRAQAAPAAKDGRPIDTSTDFAVEWDYRVAVDAALDQTSMTFHDNQGLSIFDQSPWEGLKPMEAGTYRTRCIVPANLLNDGRYFVSFQFRRAGQIMLEMPRALVVDVVDSNEGRFGWYGKWPGVIRPKLEWTTERIEP